MTRLIDADALKKENERLLHCDFPYLSEITLEELIDEAPTIDAIPIEFIQKRIEQLKGKLIRCKDCKYNDAQQWVACTLIPQMFGKNADNNFCSYAEPKVKK